VSGAETVYVTHGYSEIFAQWLISKGLNGRVVQTAYGDDDASEPELIEEVSS
jgi:putative mRNA 3-end processing factor